MRERARLHLILQHRRLTAGARQARRRLWATALNQVENGSGPDDLPLPLRDALGRDALHRLHRYASTGGNHETDGAGYTAIARLLDMPARDFAELDISEYADRLSRTDRNRLSARQDLIRKQINGDHTTFDPLNYGTRRRLATLFEQTGLTGARNSGLRARITLGIADKITREALHSPELMSRAQQDEIIRRSYSLLADQASQQSGAESTSATFTHQGEQHNSSMIVSLPVNAVFSPQASDSLQTDNEPRLELAGRGRIGRGGR